MVAVSLLATGCIGSYEDPSATACADESAKALQDILDGEANVSVPCATVTFVRPHYADSDPEGIFVAATTDGPGLYLEIPHDELEADFGFLPGVGDLIGFKVDGEIELDGDVRREIHALKQLYDLGPSNKKVASFARDHTHSATLYDDRRNLDYTLGSVNGRIFSPFGFSGVPFKAANFDNLEDQGQPPGIYPVKARFHGDVVERYGLVGGCLITVGPTPLWPRNGNIPELDFFHFTAWEESMFEVHECPSGVVISALAPDGQVELTLEASDFGDGFEHARHWHPDTSDASAFIVDGITATSLANEGDVLRLEVPGLEENPKLTIELDAEIRVEDYLGQRVRLP